MASEASIMLEEPASVPLPASPHISVGSTAPTTDSMVSVRLSEPNSKTSHVDDGETTSTGSDLTVEPISSHKRRSSTDIMNGVDLDTEINAASRADCEDDVLSSPRLENENERALSALLGEGVKDVPTEGNLARRGSSSSADSDTPVDWPALDRTEESEPRDCGSDEV